MLYVVARSCSASHACLPRLRRPNVPWEILVLVHICLLYLRLCILSEGNWHAVRYKAVRAHHGWYMGNIGILGLIRIDVVILRRYMLVRGIVTRHVFHGVVYQRRSVMVGKRFVKK